MKHKFKHGTIYQGDCLELMKDIPDNSVDMVLADLPYGTTACKWDSVIPFKPLWRQYKRIGKEACVFAFTACQPFTSKLVLSNIDWFRNDYAWDKVSGANFMNLKNRPWKTKEDVLIFSKVAGFTFNPIRVNRCYKSLKRHPGGSTPVRKSNHTIKHYNVRSTRQGKYGKDKHPIDIIKFHILPNDGNRYTFSHPTKKPVRLFEYLIKTYTNKGDLVLDNVIGSGTTGVATYNTGRRFIGTEKDADIYEMAVNRIDTETKQLKLFNTPNNKPFKSDARGAAAPVVTELSLPLAPLN